MKTKTRALVECAVLIALGTVLAQIKIFRMPSGGSVTAASMLPFIIVAYRWGTKYGLLAGLANALLQMLLGGIYPPVAPGFIGYAGEVLLDYLLAYIVLGLSLVFANMLKKRPLWVRVLFSSFAVCLLRYVCAVLSGFLVWASVLTDGFAAVIYSFGYNGAYMGPETVITCVAAVALAKLYPPVYSEVK